MFLRSMLFYVGLSHDTLIFLIPLNICNFAIIGCVYLDRQLCRFQIFDQAKYSISIYHLSYGDVIGKQPFSSENKHNCLVFHQLIHFSPFSCQAGSINRISPLERNKIIRDLQSL